MRSIWLIAKSVLIEAVRRKEIYVIVLVVVSAILVTGTVRFFGYEGMSKFYREVSLKIMNLATMVTVVVLSARQLPREFDTRTIYPLLAKPVGRVSFLLGKFLGVMLAGWFCYALFVILFLVGMKYLGADLDLGLFAQTVYLQMLALSVVASLSFMLSLLFNADAAITVAVLVFALGGTLSGAISLVYEHVSTFGLFSIPWLDGSWYQVSIGQLFMQALNYGIPQLTLFDLSGKLVHENSWDLIGLNTMAGLSVYASVFLFVYLGIAYLLFAKRPL